MVGSSKRQSKPVKFIGLQRSVTHNSGRQGRRQKALLKKKYYLDIKNDNTRRKLEESLISLGATVEVFFDPCVNAVVTDRRQWLASLGNNSGPSPSPIPSLSSVYSPCGGEQAPRRNKTRLDSILEQARLQPQQLVRDPLDDAKRCGVPIYSLAKFSQFLERLEAALKKGQAVKTKKLEGHFIKVEHCDRNHRPFYGQFKRWAFVNLAATQPGSSPFDAPTSESTEETESSPAAVPQPQSQPQCSRLTEASNGTGTGTRRPHDDEANPRSRMTRTGGPRLPGFCEMCNVQYASQRSHLACESHVDAKCDTSYRALDALISRGPAMEAFVELNKVDALKSLRSEGRPEPMSPHTANGGGRKRSKGAGARTRSMSGGQLYLPSGLLGTTAEDVGNPVRTALPSPGRKRPGNSERASSADEARPQLNGGGGGLRRRRQSQLGAKRRSQLAVLSDEAQNFMFREPPGHDGSSDDDEEEEEEDSRSSRVSVKIELDSNSLDSQGVRRKKRRSQAEAFIEDNREYYKFETPSSRLRFHDNHNDANHRGNAFEEMDRESAGVECVRREVKKEGCTKECFVKREGEGGVKSEPTGYRFSFERVPRSEPWYQTFLRQDLGEEFYYSLPSADDEPFPLPYQLPPPRLNHPPPPPRATRRGGAERRPRKSPRCHASTLAILSGFIQRRRREGAEPKEEPPTIVPPTTRPRGRPRRTLLEHQRPPSEPDKEELRPETNGDLTKLARMLDEILDVSGEDLDAVDIPANPEQLVPFDRPAPGVPVPVSSLMQERCDCCPRPPPDAASKPRHSEWRTRKRKKRRRFNLTGWPDTRKRQLRRQLRVKEERLAGGPAHDEATNCSSCFTDCEGSDDSDDERTLAHFARPASEPTPDPGVPSTRRLRSAGTPVSRRESPRKTGGAARESVS